MALDTIYMLKFRQQWGAGGKEQQNVFFFDHTAGDGVASDLAGDFGDSYVPAINAMQTSYLRNYSIDVINLGDLGDFASVPTLGGGAYVAQTLPPYAAVGYTMKVNTRAVRKGSKRFSGVPESVQSDGIVDEPTYQGYMETLRNLLWQELVSGGNTWLPIVVKRIKEPVTGTVPLQYTYRLPTTGDTLVTGEVVVALTSNVLTHQTSREV